MAGILTDSYRSLAETTFDEQWKDIEGFEGVYQVSSAGRVRSKDRKVHTYIKPGLYLRQNAQNGGYLYVSLSKNDGSKIKHAYVHRLVATAFVPNPGGLTQVNHKNLDKKDNRAENLEWVTPQENILHFRRSRMSKKYDDGKRRTLRNKSLQFILDNRDFVCEMYSSGKSIKQIAEETGLGRDRVRDILCIYDFI